MSFACCITKARIQTVRQTDSQSDRHTVRQLDIQTDIQSDRQSDRQTVRQTDSQTDRQSDSQPYRQSFIQTDSQTDRQTLPISNNYRFPRPQTANRPPLNIMFYLLHIACIVQYYGPHTLKSPIHPTGPHTPTGLNKL
jgi:hypothetical protein